MTKRTSWRQTSELDTVAQLASLPQKNQIHFFFNLFMIDIFIFWNNYRKSEYDFQDIIDFLDNAAGQPTAIKNTMVLENPFIA